MTLWIVVMVCAARRKEVMLLRKCNMQDTSDRLSSWMLMLS